MAQDASEIREAIEQTRGDIGETLEAIGQKADVKARASDKVAEAGEAVKTSTAGVQAKLSEVAERLGQTMPDAVQPAVSSTAQWAKSAAQPAGDIWRRQKLALSIGLAAALLVLWAGRARRRR